MRDLLEKLDSISTPVNEAASVSINMNADTCDDVGELMKLMTNAGLKPSILQTAKMDDPENPGKDDVAGDQDLNAGLGGRIGGTILGTMGGTALAGPYGGIAGGMAGGEIGDRITGDGWV